MESKRTESGWRLGKQDHTWFEKTHLLKPDIATDFPNKCNFIDLPLRELGGPHPFGQLTHLVDVIRDCDVDIAVESVQGLTLIDKLGDLPVNARLQSLHQPLLPRW